MVGSFALGQPFDDTSVQVVYTQSARRPDDVNARRMLPSTEFLPCSWTLLYCTRLRFLNSLYLCVSSQDYMKHDLGLPSLFAQLE